jgi:membrane-bound lytic murein transglycosylase A
MGPRWRHSGATAIALLAITVGCATAPQKPTLVTPPSVPVTRYSATLRLETPEIPAFQDDMDTASLKSAALQSLAYYQSVPDTQLFVLGQDTYTAHEMADSMAFLSTLLDGPTNYGDLFSVLRSSFTWYQSVGTDPNKTVVFSSYYEPTIAVRRAKSKPYQFPLYARPADLIDVDLSLFDPLYQGMHVAGRREGNALVPYLTRADIDSRKLLAQEGLELAWSKDPLDILDLQIEGSGWLDFGDGNPQRIRYDGNNGRKYRSVGQYVISTGRIPAKKFSRTAFLHYMASHPKQRQTLLNVNERYIFFRIDTSTAAPFAYGDISVPLTPGRSIALDPKLFPKGVLAWINVASGPRRFMLNQDEGSAIQGPGRVDVFAGHGPEAKQFATHFWNQGQLYFLVKKR